MRLLIVEYAKRSDVGDVEESAAIRYPADVINSSLTLASNADATDHAFVAVTL
jgi:hypothetical protein